MELPLIVVLAFQLASGDADWPKFLQDTDRAYALWQQDHADGDWKRFIDDRILELQKPRDGKTLKRALFWVALYKEKNQPASQLVIEISKQFEGTFKNVNWDKLWKKIEAVQQTEAKR